MILDLHRQGLSVSAIARESGLDRKTVRNYIARGLEAPAYGPRRDRPRLLAPYEAYLRERVKAYPGLTGRRLLREIRALGYGGGYSALTDYLREVRPNRSRRGRRPASRSASRRPPAGLSQDFQAQVDFAHFRVAFGDEPGATRVVWLLSLVLGFSRLIWARFVAHQDLPSLLRCHMAAFEAIGGVPREVLYDRMKTAVTGSDAEGGIVYNAKLLELAHHYGFRPRACRPYRAKTKGAKTKGKVERPFRYIREDFFLAGSFRNLEDLNGQLAHWLAGIANSRRHATTGRIVNEAFAEERSSLQVLPLVPFRSLLKLERRVSHEGMVSVGGNLYSVPDTTRRRVVEVHCLANEIRIFEAGTLIATHPPLEGRGRRRVAPGHRKARRPVRGEAAREAPLVLTERAGDRVARRPLELYQALARQLAQAGDQVEPQVGEPS